MHGVSYKILSWSTKNIRVNSTHYFIKQISNKQELQHTSINRSSHIDFKNFIKLWKKIHGIAILFLSQW